MEPVCNKINRGVVRERTHGGQRRGGQGSQKGKRAGAGRGWLARGWFGGRRRTRKTRRRGYAGEGNEGRQNHPAAGYSHPLDEATDCDGVPPSSISSSSSSSSTSSSSSASSSSSCSSAAVALYLSPLFSYLAIPTYPLEPTEQLSLANLLGVDAPPVEWYVLPSSLPR